MGTLLGRKLREIDEHLCCTRHLHIEHRLLNFLNELCKKNLEYTDDSFNRFVLPMSKGDIANYLGMRAESLSRALRQLEVQGIIENSTKRKSTVINKQKLLSELIKNSA